MLAAFNLINLAVSALVGLLNIFGATQKVSDIIAARIQAGRTDWSDAERDEVVNDLEAAKSKADAQITAAGG